MNKFTIISAAIITNLVFYVLLKTAIIRFSDTVLDVSMLVGLILTTIFVNTLIYQKIKS